MRIIHFFSLAICIFIIGCHNDEANFDLSIGDINLDAERATSVNITYSDSAQIQVQIKGPVMINHLSNNEQWQEFPDGIHVDFYAPDGRITSILTAKAATRYNSKGMVVLQDSVVWKSEDQRILETSELIWDENEQKVYNNKFLVITSPQDTVFGKGFTANQNFTDIVIIGTDGRLRVESME